MRHLAIRDETGRRQETLTTDVHPFWVVTDSPDANRMARELVMVENVGSSPIQVLHEKLGVTDAGYYIEAGDLLPGDVFLGPNGELATLVQTWRIEYPEGTPVYNFHVADDHNYFVIANYADYANGAQPVLVHNNLPCGADMPQLPKPGEDLYVGSYGQSYYGNKKTGLNISHNPHHAVQDAVSPTTRSKGATINLHEDLHKKTRSYNVNISKNETPRQSLGRDVMDIKKILTDAGYDRKLINQQLTELINLNKKIGGNIFDPPPRLP